MRITQQTHDWLILLEQQGSREARELLDVLQQHDITPIRDEPGVWCIVAKHYGDDGISYHVQRFVDGVVRETADRLSDPTDARVLRDRLNETGDRL